MRLIRSPGSGSRPDVRRRDFAIIFVVLMSVAAGNSGLQSVLPAIGREIHIPDPLVAGIFSLSALLWTLSAPVWARLSDQYGRKPMILIGLGGFVISMTGCAFVVLAGLRHLIGPMVVFAGFASLRAIFGLIGSASNPAGQAYVAERTNASERTDALATLAGAFGVGTVLGPAIAPFFVLPFVSFSGPMFGFAGAALVCLFLVVQGLPPETGRPALSFGRGDPLSRWGWRKANTSRSIWLDPRVSPFLLYGFLVGSAQAVNGYTLGFLVIDKVKMSPALAQNFIQVAMMAGAVAGLMAQWGLIRIFRMKPNHLLLWGAGLAAFGNLLIVLAPTYGAMVSAYALINIGYGFARPGFSAGASLGASTKDQGKVAGAVTAVNGSCVIITPILGVWLYDHVHDAPFLINTVVLGLMAGFGVWNATLRASGEVREAPLSEADGAALENVANVNQVGMGESPNVSLQARPRHGPVDQFRRRWRRLKLLEARRRRARLRP